ncbi:hypothetical protein quinque_006408 [Culex quinquefasciatus]
MADKRPETGQGIDALIDKLKAQLPRYQEASVKQYRDFIEKNVGLFDVPERGKCNRKAAQLRQVGNRLYLEEKYNDALEKFNESICFAENDSDQLGMGYANRSAVYFEKGEYEFALANIELAKKHNYPDKLMPKLLARERNCHDRLQHGQSHGTVPFPPMDINVDVNPKIPFVADGISMKIYKEFGRGLVAEEDFRAGSVILDEKPALVTNSLSYRYTNCSFCAADFSYSLIPCPGCVSYMYCSERCLQKDKRFSHRFECGIAEKLLNATYVSAIVGPKLFFLGLTLFGDDLEAMMEFCNGESAKGVGDPFELDFNVASELDQFKVLHKAGVYNITVIDFYRRIGAAVNYVVFMKYSPLKDLVKTKAQRNFVLHCLLEYTRKGGALLLNTPTGSSTVSLFGSICNHSCDPNAVFSIQSGHIKLALLRPVRKGEQIVVTYGPSWWQPDPNYQSSYTCKCVVCVGRKWVVKRYSLPPGATRQGEKLQNALLSRGPSNPEKLILLQQYIERYAPYHPDVQLVDGLKSFHFLLYMLMQFHQQRLDRAKAGAGSCPCCECRRLK